MLRRAVCLILALCLLAGCALAEPTATAQIPAGSLVNGMKDAEGSTDIEQLQQQLISLGLLSGEAFIATMDERFAMMELEGQ